MTDVDKRITRRTIAKGAAWSVPVVAVSAAAPAVAASNQDCPHQISNPGVCTYTVSDYPWLVYKGGPGAPANTGTYGTTTNTLDCGGGATWSTTYGLPTTLRMDARLYNNSGNYLSVNGQSIQWVFTITVPTANATFTPQFCVGNDSGTCGRSVTGNDAFPSPSATAGSWVANGDGTSTLKVTVTSTGTNYSMDPNSDIYVSFTVSYFTPILPGTSGTTRVLGPALTIDGCTSGSTNNLIHSATTTWYTNTDGSTYNNGYWFKGNNSTSTVPSGACVFSGTGGSSDTSVYTLGYC